jgi:DNA-binding MarR family transcriptional regulator
LINIKKSSENAVIKNNKGGNSSILLWEIIHFIAEANFGGRNVSMSDIYLSLGISKSTAIRCVTLLENLEILEKSRDRNDRRCAVITLNEEFRTEFVGYLDYIISELVEITGMQPESRS